MVAEAITVARDLGDRACLAEAAAVWGSVTLWNWRPHGVVDDDMVALLDDLVAEQRGGGPIGPPRTTHASPGCWARWASSSPSPPTTAACSRPPARVELARRLGDPELLGRTLNNFSIAVWGRPGAAELRLAAADESLALAGRGLPRRTEFFARLHRAAIRLHLADLAGFEADHAQAKRLAVLAVRARRSARTCSGRPPGWSGCAVSPPRPRS